MVSSFGPKNQRKFFPGILPLPLKRGCDKNFFIEVMVKKTTDYYNNVPSPFGFDLFLEARAEILTIFSLIFWS